MPVSEAYRPDPCFAALGESYADPVEPAAFPRAVVRLRNDRVAARVGLDTLTNTEWISAFARFEPLPGNQPQPLAMRYHGHQFGTYNPRLGDGRGFLFGQLREIGSGRLLDLGTKGSGQTPWSRDGDGRLTLKGAMREALATEMLEALGVPTSKTLSVIETGEELWRGDEPSPTRSAVLVRLSHSHIRFGTFQRLAWFDEKDRINELIGHVVALYYPGLSQTVPADRPAALLQAVARTAARLVARWTAAGFAHGVLNTDNMNITGESFDYGPYRFVPFYDPRFTAAYFDEAGLYAFGRQAEAVFWNLQQLAGCFALVSEAGPLVEALNIYGEAWQAELRAAFLQRLGVSSAGDEADTVLVRSLLKFMGEAKDPVRWEPVFFDWFSGSASHDRAMGGPRAAAYAGVAFDAFRRELEGRDATAPERLEQAWFARSDPEELLYDEIEAIWSAIADRDDWSSFHAKIDAIGGARTAWGFAAA